MKDYCQLVSECYAYNPEQYKEKDFDLFWEKNQKLRESIPLNLEMILDSKDEKQENYHIFYDGCDGTRVHGIMVKPTGKEKLSFFVNYHGFGGNCGKFEDFYKFTDEGFFAISIDIRGQGGKTEDIHEYTFGEHIMTRGGDCENEFYFRWVILDALRAIDVGCSLDFWDGELVAVHGSSQGGALSVTASAQDKRVKYCLCDVPSNSDLRERIKGRTGSWGNFQDLIDRGEMTEERAFKTVSYFDTMNMAENIKAHVFAVVGLRDVTCPPKQFFATYNKINSPKTIDFYYEGGHQMYPDQDEKKIGLLKIAKQNQKEK